MSNENNGDKTVAEKNKAKGLKLGESYYAYPGTVVYDDNG